MDNYKKKVWLSYFLLAAAIIGLYHISQNFSAIWDAFARFMHAITPFFVAFIIAYILNIPYEFFRRVLAKSKYNILRKNRRAISLLLSYILLLVLVAVSILTLGPIFSSIVELGRALPEHYARLTEFTDEFLASEFFRDLNLEIFIYNNELVIDFDGNAFTFNFMDMITGWFDQIRNIPMGDLLVSLSDFIIRMVLSLIASVYMLAEKERFQDFGTKMLKLLFKRNNYDNISRYLAYANNYFKKYIFCQSIDALILGVLVFVQMTLLRIPYAPMLALMLGLLNYIPIFGSIIGSVIAVILILITEGSTTALIAAILLLVTQQIDANFISPKLLGASFKISPLVVIIGISVGGFLGGPFGMVVAIPMIAILKNLFDEYVVYLEKKKLKE